jgi:hypothetical protein
LDKLRKIAGRFLPLLRPAGEGGFARLAVIAVVLALSVAATAVILSFHRPQSASANSVTMDIRSGTCTPQAKCTVTTGDKFTVEISAPTGGIPSGGYSGYQIVLQYSAAFNLNPSPPVSKWQGCASNAFATQTPSPGVYIIICKDSLNNPFFVDYTGPLLNVQFVCKQSSGTITLVGGSSGSQVSFYYQPNSNGQPNHVFLKSSQTLTINCVPPTPTPTQTFTPTSTFTPTQTFTPTSTATNTPTATATFTPTSTATSTPTATRTSTATSTRTPTRTPTVTQTPTTTGSPTVTPTSTKVPDSSLAKMAFRIYADKAKTQLVCDVGPIIRDCALEANTPFSVDVLALQPPSGGYTGYEIEVQYSGALNLQPQSGVTENRWPDCAPSTAFESTAKPNAYIVGCKTGIFSPPLSSYAGVLANVQFVCKSGTGQIDLVAGAQAQTSFYSRPGAGQPLRIYLKSLIKSGGKAVADSFNISCLSKQPFPGDTDGDGCPDVNENGSNPFLGGQRNFLNPWDYFDPNHDGRVRIDDIVAVVAHYFLDANDPGYSQDFDRSYVGPNPWNLGPPDGQIRIEDVIFAVDQYFHDCPPP